MDVKIKNITIEVDEQEFSFTHKTLVENAAYNSAKDPEVQGKSIEDVATENAPASPEAPEAPVEATSESKPIDPTPEVAEPVVEAPAEVTPAQ